MGEIKGKFNYRIFLFDPQIFTQIFDRPYLRKGADIRTLSSPDARGPSPLQICSQWKFLYGHSKGVKFKGENFQISKKTPYLELRMGDPQFLFQGVQHDVQTGLHANF